MDYKSDLKRLRKSYIEATPSQRLHIASQRIKNPGGGPNLLVAYVSAIEGFARSLAMHQEARGRSEKTSSYSRYRNKGAKELIKQYLDRKGEHNPEFFFGNDVWTNFGYAIEYRNLLAHECTYLGQDKYPELLKACEQVLSDLAKLEGLEFNAT